MQSIQDLLTKSIVSLYDNERFYAEVVLQMDRKISSHISKAGVCIKNHKVILFINPEYFNSLSIKKQVAVLKHEAKHILLNHIVRGKELAPDVYDKNKNKDEIDNIINQMRHRSLNIAFDASINPGIPDIGEDAIFPKQFDLPDGETAEWYFEKLKNNEKAKDFMLVDDHSLWGESDMDKEALKEKIKDLINKAAKRTRAAGLLTSDQELLISNLNKSSRDWKSDLKRFAARQIETLFESSRKKRNRRYGINSPGYIKTEELHIGVAIDTSGSISDYQLNQFMAEIKNISKYAKVTVVEADSKVKDSYEYNPKKVYTIKGRGGTAYSPALEFFSKNTNVDGVIYLGDMDTADNDTIVKPKYPVLWAIVGNQKPPVEWGRSTNIDIKDHE